MEEEPEQVWHVSGSSQTTRPSLRQSLARLLFFPPLLLLGHVPGLHDWAGRAMFRGVTGERAPRTVEEMQDFHPRRPNG